MKPNKIVNGASDYIRGSFSFTPELERGYNVMYISTNTVNIIEE